MATTVIAERTSLLVRGRLQVIRGDVSLLLSRSQHLVNGKTDVLCDLSKECGGNVIARMEGNRCTTTVLVPVLTVGATLPDQFEPQAFEDCLDLVRLQNRDGSQGSGYPDRMRANELRVKTRFTILKEHLNHLGQVCEQFVDGGSLRMSTLPARNVTNIQPCVGITFDNGRVVTHSDYPLWLL